MGNVLTDYTQDIIKPLLERLDEFADDIEIRSDFLHKIHEDGASLGKSLAATLRKQSHVRQSQHVNSRVNAPIVIEYSTNDGPSVESLPQLDKKLSPSHVFSRLETVFNVNHAELNHWLHDERLTEWSEMLMTWLDGEIIRTEQCLQLLYSCRKVFSRNL
jgi:hypothetical protein